jgi:RNA polymerase sigma-70 factor, ECF subfamily
MEASRPLQRSVFGDAAFDRLVRAHRGPLERYVRRLGASREDAEEIAATALLRAYQSPPVVHLEREWRAWLSTVARNLWIDARRRRELRLVTGDGVLEDVPSNSAPVDQIAATAEEARQICAAVALLPPAQRAALYLREVRGLSYEEIAAELGITLKAVTATLQRARGGVKQRRGRISGALSAVTCSPLALLRRGAGVARSAGASGAAAKIALPVVLMASTGGAALVAQHAAAGTRHGAPAPATRPTSLMRAPAPAKRAAATATPFLEHMPTLTSAASARRERPSAQHATAAIPAPAATVAAATTNADVPVSVPTTTITGAKHTARPTGRTHAGPAPHERNAPARHARNASRRAPGNASTGRPGAAGKHAGAGTRPATAAAASSRPVPPGKANRAPDARPATARGANAAPAASGSAHAATPAPQVRPVPSDPSGVAGKPSTGAGTPAPNAGAQAPPNAGAGAPTPPQTPAAEPPNAHAKGAP